MYDSVVKARELWGPLIAGELLLSTVLQDAHEAGRVAGFADVNKRVASSEALAQRVTELERVSEHYRKALFAIFYSDRPDAIYGKMAQRALNDADALITPTPDVRQICNACGEYQDQCTCNIEKEK